MNESSADARCATARMATQAIGRRRTNRKSGMLPSPLGDAGRRLLLRRCCSSRIAMLPEAVLELGEELERVLPQDLPADPLGVLESQVARVDPLRQHLPS